MGKFIAAMDQSGGSTAVELKRYGVEFDISDTHNMMNKMHAMRLRMFNCPAFNDSNISGVILFKDSVTRGIVPTVRQKGIAPYLKIDSGCDDNGMLKPFHVEDMCDYARAHNIVGTKMRSIIKTERWMHHVLEQQFRFAGFIADKGLIPIIEPEILIKSGQKEELENSLAKALPDYISKFRKKLILKLTLPEKNNLYSGLYMYNSVAKIVGLSGGYSTDEACTRLGRNNMSASFSRALSQGLYIDQTDNQFNIKLASNIQKIKAASS